MIPLTAETRTPHNKRRLSTCNGDYDRQLFRMEPYEAKSLGPDQEPGESVRLTDTVLEYYYSMGITAITVSLLLLLLLLLLLFRHKYLAKFRTT